MVLEVDAFGLLQEGLVAFLAQQFDEGLVFGQGPVGAQQLEAGVLRVAFGEQALCLHEGVLCHRFLLVEELNDKGL